jgi:argininosuccinate lyase
MRRLSRLCDDRDVGLQDLPLDDYKEFSDLFEQDVYDITAESSAAARDNPGGTAPGRVAAALKEASKILEDAADGF